MRSTLAATALAAAFLLVPCSPAEAGRSRALRTGQRVAYGAAGEITAGVEPKYEDRARVVFDKRTGLTWRKFLYVPYPQGNFEGTFSWTASAGLVDTDGEGEPRDGKSFDGTAADLLAELNTEPCFEGHCDWRLPTVAELFTLVEFGPEHAEPFAWFPAKDGPMIRWPFHSICNCENRNMTPMSMMRWAQMCMAGYCSCAAKASYWSSTTSPIDPTKAMAVDFGSGEVQAIDKTAWLRVRPVRGPSRPG